jgi:hypothetical protein
MLVMCHVSILRQNNILLPLLAVVYFVGPQNMWVSVLSKELQFARRVSNSVNRYTLMDQDYVALSYGVEKISP